MKRTLRPPRFLTEVLRAICALKETGGSNSKRIVSHVKANASGSFTPLRNLSTQVRRALNHATYSGLVKQRAGKYRINSEIINPVQDCVECKKRKMRQKQRRRRRRRVRQRGVTSRNHRGVSVDFDLDSSDELPVRELRRRGKRRGGTTKKRRRRRRRTTDSLPENKNEQKNEKDEKNSGEDLKKDIVYPDDINSGDDGNNPDHDNNQCDNPDCLCNVREDNDEIMNTYNPPM